MPANPSDADEVTTDDATTSNEMNAGATGEGEIIRTGSPFAPGSVIDAGVAPGASSTSSTSPEVLTDGVMKYTAKGSATASLMVVFFAVAAAWWFPAGGILIAALGCGLAVGGMFSDYRLPSAGLLVVHLGLFFFSYTLVMN